MLPHLANVVVDGVERSADGIRLKVHARAGQWRARGARRCRRGYTVGVDDFAVRRGHVYGTVLIDLAAILCDAVERSVPAHRRCLPTPPAPAAAEPTAPPDPTVAPAEQPWRTGNRFAERTRRTHTAVHALLEAGHTHRAISRQLRMGRHSVRKFAQAARPENLFRGQWQDRPSGLDPFRAHLDA